MEKLLRKEKTFYFNITPNEDLSHLSFFQNQNDLYKNLIKLNEEGKRSFNLVGLGYDLKDLNFSPRTKHVSGGKMEMIEQERKAMLRNSFNIFDDFDITVYYDSSHSSLNIVCQTMDSPWLVNTTEDYIDCCSFFFEKIALYFGVGYSITIKVFINELGKHNSLDDECKGTYIFSSPEDSITMQYKIKEKIQKDYDLPF